MPRCVLHDVLVYVCVCDELQVVSAPHPSIPSHPQHYGSNHE